MGTATPPRRRTWIPLILTAILLASVGLPAPGFAQESAQEPPDPAEREAQVEAMFQKALALSEENPFQAMQAWGAVFMGSAALERERNGGNQPVDFLAVTERVLDRWQRLRPESGGPDLFRAMRNQDPDARRDAVLALLSRYPDDPMVVTQAVFLLRQNDESDRARGMLEDLATRHPESSWAWGMLASSAPGNETRTAEILTRWADAIPGDPDLVSAWFGTSLPRQDPEATERLLEAFFARRPASAGDLQACSQVLRQGAAAYSERARACVARVAGNPEVPAYVASSAVETLVQRAAADDDWSGMLTLLDALEPAARVRALIGAAAALEAPDQCNQILDLLTAASEALGADKNAYGQLSSTSSLCSRRPEAQSLFLGLVRRAPTEEIPRVLYGWVNQHNGAWNGDLPEATAGILEQRLQAEPTAWELYHALDITYQVTGEADQRFELLRRWQQLGDRRFGSDEATALALRLIERDKLEEATGVLERQLRSHLDLKGLELLAGLYQQTEGAERVDRFTADLIASDDPWTARTGHRLAARTALTRRNFAAAERHYWEALRSDHPDRDVAVELLAAVGLQGDAARSESTARRICREARPDESSTQEPVCVTDLLTRAGGGETVSALLAQGAAKLPDDPDSLYALASTAQGSGQVALAERAWRRLLEIDPRNETSWSSLGIFLERQGRTEDLLALLERSREVFQRPPTFLYRSAGRALTAAGEPRRAIEIFTEAQSTLPDRNGKEWSHSQIDNELREAYKALGQGSASVAAVAAAPRPRPAFATSAPQSIPPDRAPDLLRAAIALQSGQGGRYDPDAARKLFARAAVLGDPRAAFRLALIQAFDGGRVLPGEPATATLYSGSLPQVRALAEKGESYAQYLLGTAAVLGLGGPVDNATGRQWLEKAAAQGESWAWHNLGWMEETGRGFGQPDPASVLASYRRASEAGNARSMTALARLTLTYGNSGAPCAEGLRWLERSARTGNATAASFLGKLLFYGRGDCVRRDPKASLRWLEAALTANRPGADYDLGLALVLTSTDDGERARGVSLLEHNASLDNALAADTLAFLYATGIGVPRDPVAARRLLDEGTRLGSDGLTRLQSQVGLSAVYQNLLDQGKARLEALAERRDPLAAALLARIERPAVVGAGDEATFRRVLELARQAAAAGEPSAMRLLGDAYTHGDGVPKDTAEALRWRRHGAEAGDSYCMMFYSQALMNGQEVDRDLDAGLRWLRRAGEAGNWWAIADLGNLYDEGWYGLPRDPEEAAKWKKRLADLGDAEATGWLIYHGYR